MIRLIFVVIFVVIFLILTLPVQLVIWLLGKKWPQIPDKVSYPLVGWCFRVILGLSGMRIHVRGIDKVPKDTPVLYIGNHRSIFDVVATYPLAKNPTGYLAKDTLKKVPSLNSWMSIMHCLFLDREDIKKGLKTILDCIEMVKSGISVTIFPEGTRNDDPTEFMEFHEGSFKVATKTGCPIVPMCIAYRNDVFEDHLPLIKKNDMIIEYGDPVYPSELTPEDKKKIGAYVRNIMLGMYEKNYAELQSAGK